MLHGTGAWMGPKQNEPNSHHLPRPDPRQCLKERERAKHDQNIHAFIPQCNDHGGYMYVSKSSQFYEKANRFKNLIVSHHTLSYVSK